MFYFREFRRLSKQEVRWLLIIGFFALFTQAPLYYAYLITEIGTATLLFYAAYTLASYWVGKWVMRETITLVKIIAMLLAFCGLALIFGLSIGVFSLMGMLMAMLNGVASGFEISMSKKLTKLSSIAISFYMWLPIFFSHILIGFALGEKVPSFSGSWPWIAMILFAIVGLVAGLLVFEGFKRVDASVGSIMGLSEVVWAVVFGAVLFGESVGISVIVGGILIIIAGLLPDVKNIIEGRKNSKTVIASGDH
ncbi:DMT family transporter [Candidatus Saccharibacteria bacterium]|nr:DMT family transporter [Candidatus Saccharibacteria bacterium]